MPTSTSCPERVRARHILISMPKPGPDGKVDPKAVDEAKAKAQDIMKQAKAPGANFAELANKYSQDPGNKDPKGEGRGGELGWFSHGAMVAEFDKAAFALSPGQVSDVVQTTVRLPRYPGGREGSGQDQAGK